MCGLGFTFVPFSFPARKMSGRIQIRFSLKGESESDKLVRRRLGGEGADPFQDREAGIVMAQAWA